MSKDIRDMINKVIMVEQLIKERTYSVFHGTDGNFKDFEHNKIGSNTDKPWYGWGFYFSDSKEEASFHGNNVLDFRIQLNNPIDVTNIKDSSVQGSGYINFFSTLKGFKNIKYNNMPIIELANLINKIENNISEESIYTTDGTHDILKHFWFEYEGHEYVLRNQREDSLKNKKYMLGLMVSSILYQKYEISRLPIRISELIDPYKFTKIAKENGYDGVIAPNSTHFSGSEFVVFDKNNIKKV